MSTPLISNLDPLEASLASAGDRADEYIKILRRDYSELVPENPLYRKRAPGLFLLALLFDAVFAVWALAKLLHFAFWPWLFSLPLFASGNPARLADGALKLGTLVSKELKGTVFPEFFSLALIGLMCWNIYRTFVYIYSGKLESYLKRIDHVEKKLHMRYHKLNDKKFMQKLVLCAVNNTRSSVSAENDIGEEIADIRAGLRKACRRAKTVKSTAGLLASAVVYGGFLAYISISIKGNFYISVDGAIVSLLLFSCAAGLINLIMLRAGEFMRMFQKNAGIAMAVLYGVLLTDAMLETVHYTALPFAFPEKFAALNSIAFIMPFLQTVCLILMVVFSDYGGEKEKWNRGFEIPLQYGSKPRADKKTIALRGGLTAVLALAFIVNFALIDMQGLYTSVKDIALGIAGGRSIGTYELAGLSDLWPFTLGLLWYAANTLNKPRGSYLCVFWGRKRAAVNAVILFVAGLSVRLMLIRGELLGPGYIVAAVIMLLVSALAALVMRIINQFG